MAKDDLLISWLNDAYAMECAQQAMLRRFDKDFASFVDIQAKLQEHIAVAGDKAEEMKACIERLGGKMSPVKPVLGNIFGLVEGISTAPYKDKPVKNLLLWQAAGHFEHAAHTALAAGARACGENDVALICERIALNEKIMAGWTAQQIPKVVAAVMEAQGES